MSLIHISSPTIDQAAQTLFQAFADDPLMLWLFGGSNKYQQHGLPAVKSWVKWTTLYGLAIATSNFESVALRKKPRHHAFTFWSMIRSGMLQKSIALGKETLDRLTLLDNLLTREQRKNMGNDNFWYCWMLGTLPDKRKQGYAKELMQYTFKLSKETALPCYLETAKKDNIVFHGRQGYQLLSTVSIPDSNIQLYCMKRPPTPM